MPQVPAFRTETCRDFAAHWHAVRGDQQEPPTVKTFLAVLNTKTQPFSMIIDVPDEENLKVRLFAAGLAERAGIDVTNSNLHAFTASPVIAKNLATACMIVSRRRCGMLSVKRAISAKGRELTVESVSFPLLPDSDGPPAICTGIDVVERLSTQDTVFQIVSYVTADWLDLGFGVPDIRLRMEHQAA